MILSKIRRRRGQRLPTTTGVTNVRLLAFCKPDKRNSLCAVPNTEVSPSKQAVRFVTTQYLKYIDDELTVANLNELSQAVTTAMTVNRMHVLAPGHIHYAGLSEFKARNVPATRESINTQLARILKSTLVVRSESLDKLPALFRITYTDADYVKLQRYEELIKRPELNETRCADALITEKTRLTCHRVSDEELTKVVNNA